MKSALAVYGETGIGKTRIIWNILAELKLPFVFVRDINDLKKITSSTRVLFFDDVSFEYLNPTVLIHLCDPYYPATVRILHQVVEVPAFLIKIFTHNNKAAWTPLLATLEQQAAIERRMEITHLSNDPATKEILRLNVYAVCKKVPPIQDLVAAHAEYKTRSMRGSSSRSRDRQMSPSIPTPCTSPQ